VTDTVNSRGSLGRSSTNPEAAGADSPGVIAPPPLIYVAGLAIGFGLEILLPSASLPRAPAWALGAALIAAGIALARSFFAALRRARTPVNPYEATTTIVTTGPYRVRRNPGYLGMALAFAGTAVLAGALWALAALVPTLIVMNRGVIAREERYLEHKFGKEYTRYKARTRRWL
jgi:protein-S-isoprenylcysteine O-methyltransferase Ste14